MAKKSVLLAPNEQIAFDDPRIIYPKLGSLKFDGTRCVCVAGELLSRSMKPQKNQNLPKALEALCAVAEGRRLVFDFELYDHTMPNHGAHTSVLASHKKEIPDTMLCHVFDVVPLDYWTGATERQHPAFRDRVEMYHNILETSPEIAKDPRYQAVEQVELVDPECGKALFEIAIEQGYEGAMLRCPDGRYKHGRSSIKEGLVLKFKDFHTIDGVIVDVIQRRKLKEGIERTTTPTGHMERVHTKDSYELDDMVGAFKVEFEDGTVSEVNYGRGFNHEDRQRHWHERQSLIGKAVEVKHLPHGAKEGIRIGSLVRFRPDKD